MSRTTVAGLALVTLLLAALVGGLRMLHVEHSNLVALRADSAAAAVWRVEVERRAALQADSLGALAVALERVASERDSAAALVVQARARWEVERTRAIDSLRASGVVDLVALIGAGDDVSGAALAVVDVTDVLGSLAAPSALTLPALVAPVPRAAVAASPRSSYWRGARDGAIGALVVALSLALALGG